MDKIEKLKKERSKIELRADDLIDKLYDCGFYDKIYKICKKIIALLEKKKMLDKKIKTADRQK